MNHPRPLPAPHPGTQPEAPDPIFAEPRLAAVYDVFDGDRKDLDLYEAVAEELRAHKVIDVGCGTGCLALRLAAGGRSVVALDPAAASLAVARAKDGASQVTWIHGDATALPDIGADLAVMTGNVAQVFLTDDAWARTLDAIGRALRPGGRLVFETRRPEAEAWLEWATQSAPVEREVPGIGTVRQQLEVTEVNLPYVSFRYTYRFASDGAVLTSESTLRFTDRAAIESSLTAHGYRVTDLRQAPDRPGREFVFIAAH